MLRACVRIGCRGKSEKVLLAVDGSYKSGWLKFIIIYKSFALSQNLTESKTDTPMSSCNWVEAGLQHLKVTVRREEAL